MFCRGAGVGAVAGNVVALAAGQLAPDGALRAGVLAEIWTGEMIKTFRTAPEAPAVPMPRSGATWMAASSR